MAVREIRSSVASRIKQLRKDKNYSQTYIAKDLSITQAAYSRIENSTNGIVAEHIIKLSDLFDVTTDYILKGNSGLIEISFKTGFLPLVEAKAHAGFVENYNERVNYDDRDWFKIPGFNPTVDHKLFEVEGESMAPTVLPGDILVCQIQHDIKKIIKGTLILLITDKGVLAKRYGKLEKGKLYVESDNPDFSTQEEKMEIVKIKEVFLVHGKISSFLIPGHHVISTIKLKDLEENIEMLKREMFSFQKKLMASNK